jgi:hypothetical protein
MRVIDELNSSRARTQWDAMRRRVCAEALIAWLDLLDELPLKNLRVVRAPVSPPKLHISGVLVSVRPEFILTRMTWQESRGALKFSFSKTEAVEDEAGDYASMLVCQFLEEVLKGGERVDRRLCGVVDVFGRKLFTAPRATVYRKRDVRIACKEIAALWAST